MKNKTIIFPLVLCSIFTSIIPVYSLENNSETSTEISTTESTSSGETSTENTSESTSSETPSSSSEQSTEKESEQSSSVILEEGTKVETSKEDKKPEEKESEETKPEKHLERASGADNFVSVKGTRIKGNFSAQTKAIVDAHLYDFNATNFYERMAEFGGYENYLRNHLGGVFAKWAGKNNIAHVKSASELQEISEYCYGLMTIYGFDYCNGDPSRYKKWGAKYGVTDDAFYPKGTKNATGKVASPNQIDIICAGETKGGLNMTTCCNWGVDLVYRKAGLFGSGRPNSSCSYKSLIRDWGGKIVTRAEDLRVGDLVECFRSPITNYDDPDSWKNWGHVCFVGEVNKAAGTFTLYEAGSFFTNSGNYKNVRKISSGVGWEGWVGIRLFDLVQDYMVESEVVKEGDSYYYYDGRSHLSGWKEYLGNKYYFDPETLEGYIGWHNIDGIDYYFNENATLAVGVNLIDDTYYLFDENGIKTSGWGEIDGKQYYFENGLLSNNCLLVDGVPYHFVNGLPVYGFTVIDGKPYMLQEDESLKYNGWYEDALYKCYFIDNEPVNGWQEIDGTYYYFENYFLASGLTNIDGDIYYLKNGVIQTGYIVSNGNGYFFRDDGKAVCGEEFCSIAYGENGAAEDFVKYKLYVEALSRYDIGFIFISDTVHNKSLVIDNTSGNHQIVNYLDTPKDMDVNKMEQFYAVTI